MPIVVMQRLNSGHHVGLATAVDLPGLVERLAALPELYHKWKSGFRQGTGAPVPRYQQGIFVHPSYLLFGPGQHEATRNELPCLQVELAHGDRILTSGPEPNEAELVFRVEAGSSLLDPFLVILFPQRVVVQQRLPVRPRGEVVGEGSA